MQQQLLKCCVVIHSVHSTLDLQCWHNNTWYVDILFFILILLFLSVAQTAAVGPVLRVNKQLHLELGSQHGFSCGLFFLLNGFDLGLENKILVRYQHSQNDIIKIQRGKTTDSDYLNVAIKLLKDGYLGCFHKVRKSSEATLGQLYEHLPYSIWRKQK